MLLMAVCTALVVLGLVAVATPSGFIAAAADIAAG